MENPDHILKLGFGFWGAKVLLSAVEMDLFTQLGAGPLTLPELRAALGLDGRGARDFLDALVALGLLHREGDGDSARYGNSPDAATFLDRRQPAYVGGLLRMANDRLYGIWTHLTEGLRSGLPQNEIKQTGRPLFEALYADSEALEAFLQAMAGVSAGACLALAEKVDFSRWHTLLDAGGATGLLSICVARRHPHLRAITLDLPPVASVAKKTVAAAGLGERIEVIAGDFFAAPLPRADVVCMAHVLHDWDLPRKLELIRRAWEALPSGGAFIAIDSMIDDERRTHAFGLLMSLNMLLETPGGFDYSGAELATWCREVGFSSIDIIPLAGPASAAVAIK